MKGNEQYECNQPKNESKQLKQTRAQEKQKACEGIEQKIQPIELKARMGKKSLDRWAS